MSVSQTTQRPGGIIGRPPTAGSGVWSLDDLQRYPQLTIPGLVMWIDASNIKSVFQNSDGTTTANDESPVGYVTDLSGNENHAIQSTGAAMPTFKVGDQNGRPGLYFDGSDDFLTSTISGFQSLSGVTVLQVIKPVLAASANTETCIFWGFGNVGASSGIYPADRFIGSSSATGALAGETIVVSICRNGSSGRLGSSTYARLSNTCQLFSARMGSSGTNLRVNNSDVSLNLSSGVSLSTPSGPSDTGYTVDDDLHIGGVRALGSIVAVTEKTMHEMLVFNRVLTDAELSFLWAVLKNKWQL